MQEKRASASCEKMWSAHASNTPAVASLARCTATAGRASAASSGGVRYDAKTHIAKGSSGCGKKSPYSLGRARSLPRFFSPRALAACLPVRTARPRPSSDPHARVTIPAGTTVATGKYAEQLLPAIGSAGLVIPRPRTAVDAIARVLRDASDKARLRLTPPVRAEKVGPLRATGHQLDVRAAAPRHGASSPAPLATSCCEPPMPWR